MKRFLRYTSDELTSVVRPKYLSKGPLSALLLDPLSHVLRKNWMRTLVCECEITWDKCFSQQGCRFPHPKPIFFRETAFFQLFRCFPTISSHSRENGVISGRDRKISSPVSPCTALRKSIRFVQAFGQPFSGIIAFYSSSSSLYRINELLSRMKYRNHGIFYHDV